MPRKIRNHASEYEQRKSYQKQHYLLNRESILLKKKLYRQKNKDSLNQQKNTYRKLHPEVSRKSKLKSKYGLTLTQFNSLLQSSANRCPICLEPFSSRGLRRPVVDHCHNSNTVRGLLCMACNTVEGMIRTPQNAKRLYEFMLNTELFYFKTLP